MASERAGDCVVVMACPVCASRNCKHQMTRNMLDGEVVSCLLWCEHCGYESRDASDWIIAMPESA